MKYILILTVLFLSACSDRDPHMLNIEYLETVVSNTKAEIVKDCQDKGYFTHGILKFSCEQMFVVEE